MALILQDRSTTNKYEVKITNSELLLSISTDDSISEPVLNDTILSSTYWKVYISYGQLVIESSTEVGNEYYELTDTSNGDPWYLKVENGQLIYSSGLIRKVVPKIKMIMAKEYFTIRIKIEDSVYY